MHLRQTLVLIVLLFSAAAAFSETIISGPLLETQTWTEAGSPYLVVSSVEVVDGCTLNIESGVVVKFSEDVDFRGRILVAGTADAPVLFTSVSDNPHPGSYGHVGIVDFHNDIHLSHLTVEYSYSLGVYGDQVHMDHLTVQFTEYSAALTLGQGDFYLDNCIVRDNGFGGILVRQLATAYLDNCDIFSHSGMGLIANASANAEANTQVRNSRIHDNGGWGLVGVGTAINSEIYNHNVDGIMLGSPNPNTRHCEVVNCDFTQNGNSAIKLHDYVGNTPAIITECNFMENQNYALDLSRSHACDTVDARGNFWGETTLEEIMVLINMIPQDPDVPIASLIIEPFESTVGTQDCSWDEIKAYFR